MTISVTSPAIARAKHINHIAARAALSLFPAMPDKPDIVVTFAFAFAEKFVDEARRRNLAARNLQEKPIA